MGNRVQNDRVFGWVRGSASIAVAAALIVATALPAFATSDKPPRIEGAVPVELQADFDYDSDDSGNKRNNLFLKLEPEITFVGEF